MSVGNCYVNAYNSIMSMHKNTSVDNLRLFHGVCVGQGKISGLKFGHAWFEFSCGNNTFVFDGGTGAVLLRRRYYELGKIDYTVQYSPEEADKMAERHNSFGPWCPIVAAAAHA